MPPHVVAPFDFVLELDLAYGADQVRIVGDRRLTNVAVVLVDLAALFAPGHVVGLDMSGEIGLFEEGFPASFAGMFEPDLLVNSLDMALQAGGICEMEAAL